MKIYTDSACDLPKAFYEKNDVHLFPLQVDINGTQYCDILDIEPIKIYDSIRNGVIPKTSQVAPDFFLTAFEELAKSGEQGLYVAFSSNLSGTYNTAVMIKNQVMETYPDLKLEIIDTKSASLGFGLSVQRAIEARDAGKSFEEVVEITKFVASHREHLFTVEDLDHLAKGGRVSKASAFVGGLLNIKPLLHMADGFLVPLEKLRGRKKVFKRLLDVMEERGDRLNEQIIGISHGDDLETAEEVKAMIIERFNPKDVQIQIVGSTIGCHTGPGVIAVYFLNKLEN